MNWRHGVAAVVFFLAGGLAYGQGAPSSPDGRYIPEYRVEWALLQLQKRHTEQQNQTTRPIRAAEMPNVESGDLAHLRGQINDLKKENDNLKAQVRQVMADRQDMQGALYEAIEAARIARYSAQQALGALRYPAYGWTDSWAYPGGPVFSVPAPGLTSQPFNPPAPGNALNPRLVPPNHAGPQPGGPNPTR